MATGSGSPFDVFDDSAESDEEGASGDFMEAEAIARARSLVGSVNITSAPSSTAVPESNFCLGEWDKAELPWDEPLFLGPTKIETCKEVGGERAMTALHWLATGTLILIEDPLVRWSSDDDTSIGPDVLELAFSRTDNAQKLISNAEYLHPTKAAVDLDSHHYSNEAKGLMSELQSLYEQDDRISRLLAKLKADGITNGDGSMIRSEDLLRLLLAVRFNGLESGLFCFTAMLNHADQPNCVKFKGEAYSEVRTTRCIEPGEMLTISYVPRICSHAFRRHYLWQQHRFDIGDSVPPDLFRMEHIGGTLPPSTMDHVQSESIASRIEKTTADLEGILAEMEESVEPSESLSLEQAALELLRAAEVELLNPKHILFIPILKLHVDSCYVVQRVPTLSSMDRCKLLCRLTESASRLQLLLTQLFGGEYFDVASAAMDVAQSLDDLVNRYPHHLLSSNILGLHTKAQYVAFASDAWNQCKSIKALYPKDANKIIQRRLSAKRSS